MLMQAEQKLEADASYVDVFMRKRISTLFTDLSHFIGEGARDRAQLEKLSSENGMILAELRIML